MVDFTLTDDQQQMREMAHDFADGEIRPVAWQYDKDAWPQDIITKAWELGLMNSHLPAEYGGVGATYLDGCVIGEELAWGCAAIQRHSAPTIWPRLPSCSAARRRSRRSTSGCLSRSPGSRPSA